MKDSDNFVVRVKEAKLKIFSDITFEAERIGGFQTNGESYR